LKLLILTLGRSGSTNLFNSLVNEYKCIGIDEPFINSNGIDKKQENLNKIKNLNNIVVKHIISHEFVDIDELQKYFDKKVILIRKNINKHLESIINLKYKQSINQNNSHSKYIFDDIPKVFIETHKNNILNYINYYNKLLNKISQKYNIPIIFYEDIYSDNIENNLVNIQNNFDNISNSFKKNLDSSKKYRQQKKIDILI